MPDDPAPAFSPKVLLEALVSHHERRMSQLEAINALPLYPTEDILWDENIVPSEYYNGESEKCLHEVVIQPLRSHTCISHSACLALPKLNLQFLTLHDYLLRNFVLFRLESTCELAVAITSSALVVLFPQMRYVKTLKMW